MAFKMSGVLSRSYARGLRLSLSLQYETRAVTGPRNGFRFGSGTGLPQIRKAIRFRERATPLTPASGVGARIINQPPFSCKTVYNHHHRSTARVFNSPFAVFNNAVRVPAPLIFASSSARRVVFWAGVLGLTVLGGTAASLHRSAVVAMAPKLTPVDLDSPASDWKEAKRFLESLSPAERRRFYRSSDFIPLESILPWTSQSADLAGSRGEFRGDPALDGKISLFRGDITRLEVHAVVNAANSSLLGGGGVDGSIHRSAGPLLRQQCASLGGCETGDAKLTSGYRLPAQYVIHTVGPIVQGACGERERAALRSCYQRSLELGEREGLRSLAFPCISTGVYGYPPAEAAEVALRTVREYLQQKPEQFDRIVFCVFLQSDEQIYKTKLPKYFPGTPHRSKL